MTLSRHSELNPAAAIGKILERFRLSQGWKSEVDEDHDARLTAFLEILGAARVPAELYDQLYRRTVIARARRKANGQDVSYFFTPEEMVTEFFILQKERVGVAAPRCAYEKYHATPDALVLIDLFITGKDELAPCPTCRDAEHSDWRKTQIALYGEVPIKTFLPQIETRPLGKLFVVKEEAISADEAVALATQHNLLICRIAQDEETRNFEMVIFDAGANVFKHKNRNDKLYSAKELRRRIERYGKILEVGDL